MERDEDLVAAYLKGDENAFARLAARHLKTVYSFALRFVGDESAAEDIVQETFLKTWKNLSYYSSGSARFKTWLMHILRNTAIDYLRKQKQIPFSAFETVGGENPLMDIADETATVEEVLSDMDDVEEIYRAMREVSPQHREILLLYYGNDVTLEEAAKILEVPVNTVKSRHRRAVVALRAAMHPKP